MSLPVISVVIVSLCQDLEFSCGAGREGGERGREGREEDEEDKERGKGKRKRGKQEDEGTGMVIKR